MKKRVLALLLTLVMLVSCFPMNLIAKTSSSIAGTADGPLSLTAREGKSGFATGREGVRLRTHIRESLIPTGSSFQAPPSPKTMPPHR